MCESDESKKPPLNLDRIKAWMEICSKLFVWGGLSIFGIFCLEIGRIPDVELPALALLLGISFAMAAMLVVSVAFFALLPALCLSFLTEFRSAPDPILTPVFLFVCQFISGVLLFIPGIPAQYVGSLWLLVVVLCTVGLIWLPWVSLQQDVRPQENSGTGGRAILSTHLIGAAFVCSFSAMTFAVLVLVLLQNNWNVSSVLCGLVAAILADVSVCSLLRFRSRDSWMIGGIITGLLSILVLVFVDLPKMIYRRLDVAFIECVDDSVIITGDGIRKIANAVPDAFGDKIGELPHTPLAGAAADQQQLAAIKGYHVEILSMIGKQYLLRLTQKATPHRQIMVGIPADSLWDHRRLESNQ
jgi:hypothetical protein